MKTNLFLITRFVQFSSPGQRIETYYVAAHTAASAMVKHRIAYPRHSRTSLVARKEGRVVV